MSLLLLLVLQPVADSLTSWLVWLRYSIGVLYAHLRLAAEALPHAERAAELAPDIPGISATEAQEMRAFAERTARAARRAETRDD